MMRCVKSDWPSFASIDFLEVKFPNFLGCYEVKILLLLRNHKSSCMVTDSYKFLQYGLASNEVASKKALANIPREKFWLIKSS